MGLLDGLKRSEKKVDINVQRRRSQVKMKSVSESTAARASNFYDHPGMRSDHNGRSGADDVDERSPTVDLQRPDEPHRSKVSNSTWDPPDRNQTPVAKHGDSKSAAKKPSLRDSKISNDDDENERLQQEKFYVHRIQELTAERHDLVLRIQNLENSGKEIERRLARTELERDGLRGSIAARERALRQEGVRFEDVETLEDLKARHERALKRASVAEKCTQALEEEMIRLHRLSEEEKQKIIQEYDLWKAEIRRQYHDKMKEHRSTIEALKLEMKSTHEMEMHNAEAKHASELEEIKDKHEKVLEGVLKRQLDEVSNLQGKIDLLHKEREYLENDFKQKQETDAQQHMSDLKVLEQAHAKTLAEVQHETEQKQAAVMADFHSKAETSRRKLESQLKRFAQKQTDILDAFEQEIGSTPSKPSVMVIHSGGRN